MKLFIKALLFASHHWRRSSPDSFVAMKSSSNFPLTPSLCAPPAHWRVVVSTFYQGCLPRVYRHLVFYLPSIRFYRSSATFHTGWYTAITLISPTVTAVVRSMCYLFWSIAIQSLSASPVMMMAFLLEWITTASFPSSPSHIVPSLSPLISVDNNTSHLFSWYCFVSHVVIRFNSFFLLPSILFLRFSYILSTRCCSDLLLIPFLQGLGWITVTLIADRHFASLSALPLKTPVVGKRRALAIQFVFWGVGGGWPLDH